MAAALDGITSADTTAASAKEIENAPSRPVALCEVCARRRGGANLMPGRYPLGLRHGRGSARNLLQADLVLRLAMRDTSGVRGYYGLNANRLRLATPESPAGRKTTFAESRALQWWLRNCLPLLVSSIVTFAVPALR
jgi:hypothetical protein